MDGVKQKTETILDDLDKSSSSGASSGSPVPDNTGAIEDNTAAILAANEKLAEMVRQADSLVLSDNMAVTRSVAASGTAQVAAAASSYHREGDTTIIQNIHSKAQITADCWGPHGDADAELLLLTLTYKTAGTLYFGDQWFCRFVVSKTPYTVQLHGFVRLEMMLFCPKPFWYSLTATSYTLGGYTAAFRFPVNYAQPHRFGIRQPNTFVNCRNTGALPVPFTATLRTDASVVNPCILNVITGERIRILTTLTQEQTIEIYRTTTDQLAVKRTEHQVEEHIFALLDEDSDLVELAPGDNPLKTEADSNVDNLQATVTFYPMYSGILPEVIA